MMGGGIEQRAVGFVAGLAPWLAPLPTAWLVGDRCHRLLGWPVLVAIVAAVIVECIGLAAAVTALDLHGYNRNKRKSDPGAPLALPYAIVAGYLVVTEILTVVVDIAAKPAIGPADIAPALFPPLTLAGVLILAIRASHAARLQAIAEGKAEAKEERKQRRQVPETSGKPAEALPATPQTWRQFMASYPDMLEMSGKRIAELSGVSERTGTNWKAAARNGNGHAARVG